MSSKPRKGSFRKEAKVKPRMSLEVVRDEDSGVAAGPDGMWGPGDFTGAVRRSEGKGS